MRLIIIGSLNGYVTSAAKIAMQKGAKVQHVQSTETALENLRSGRGADLVMMELNLDIKKFVEALAKERIVVPVIACSIDPDPDLAAKAIIDGAKEYLSLPPDPELIAAVLEAVANKDSSMICEDANSQKILELAKKIAPSDASVLITGESGTGKEVMAQYIHNHSKRKDKPFISLNCAAIPENLLESELFGHEKGAFTGAIARRIGKFEEANGGTLLLDEISEMHPKLQAKLLRAIQERVIDRVGGSQPVKVDIRIIATSNRDLLKASKDNEFRQDLYFRINVVNLDLIPLRDRKNDIIPLANYFIEKYCRLNQSDTKILTDGAKQSILEYKWSGNVRELENSMHRAVLLSRSNFIETEDIFNVQEIERNEQNPNFIGCTLEEVERNLIIKTLKHCLGNRTQAANILGISIRTLRNKLKEYADSDVAV